MNGEETTTPTIGLLLLAAGVSSRLGSEPKQLLAYEGESLLRHAARTALASSCLPIIVVIGAHRERIEAEIADLPVEIIFNEAWAAGMASSIRAWMEYLVAHAAPRAVVLMLCDQPHVSASLIN